MSFYNKIDRISQKKAKAALCIIVETKGSTPRKVGAKMIVSENRSIIGTIGGGNLEKKVIENALQQINKNEAKLFKHDLLHQHNMCCGGSVEIYIEPIQKMNKLYIFGAGHTGEALAKLASNLNFEIALFDDRKEYLSPINLPSVKSSLIDFNTDLEKLSTDKNTYVVIMTYSHPVDRQILSYFADKDLAYLGMIGSERKVIVTKKILKDEQVATVEQINNINMVF